MSRVTRQLKFLNKISAGTPKSQILVNPEKCAALNLTFQYQNHNGHMGARKFWHEYLPTLQFYNPSLQIRVTRVKNEDKKDVGVPCILQVLAKDGNVTSTVEMRNKDKDVIMDEFLTIVEHEKVPESDIIEV